MTALLQASLNGDLFTPAKRFTTCVADPPWWEKGGGKIKRGADRHYPLMKTSAIAALELGKHMAPNAHLYLWVTNNHLEDGLLVMRAWGFRYVTNIAWGKISDTETKAGRRLRKSIDPECKDVAPYLGVGRDILEVLNDPPRVQQGLGQYFRGAHELLLFGKRGKIPYRTTPDGKRAQHPSLVLAPRREHSEKPGIFRRIVEKVSPGPYVELFARERVDNWEAWGNEVDSSISITSRASR